MDSQSVVDFVRSRVTTWEKEKKSEDNKEEEGMGDSDGPRLSSVCEQVSPQ